MQQRPQRRTAEQIVDIPGPVLTERVSARSLGLSALFEAAKTQSTVEQICGVIEAAEASSRDLNMQRTAEQDFVEVDKTTTTRADFWTHG